MSNRLQLPRLKTQNVWPHVKGPAFNSLVDKVENASGITGIGLRVTGTHTIASRENDRHLLIQLTDVELVDDVYFYSWQAVWIGEDGVPFGLDGGPYGTVTQTPAVELNNKLIDLDTFVQARWTEDNIVYFDMGGQGSGSGEDECDEDETTHYIYASGCSDGSVLTQYRRNVHTHIEGCFIWHTFGDWEEQQSLCVACTCPGDNPLTWDDPDSDDLFWCVYSAGVVSCVKARTEPAGAVGGPYTSPGQCFSACGFGMLLYWCVDVGEGLHACVRAASEPDNTLAGPFLTLAECQVGDCADDPGAGNNNCCPDQPVVTLYATFGGGLSALGTVEMPYAFVANAWSGSSVACGGKTAILRCDPLSGQYAFGVTSTDPWTGSVVSCDPFVWYGSTANGVAPCSGVSTVTIKDVPP